MSSVMQRQRDSLEADPELAHHRDFLDEYERDVAEGRLLGLAPSIRATLDATAAAARAALGRLGLDLPVDEGQAPGPSGHAITVLLAIDPDSRTVAIGMPVGDHADLEPDRLGLLVASAALRGLRVGFTEVAALDPDADVELAAGEGMSILRIHSGRRKLEPDAGALVEAALEDCFRADPELRALGLACAVIEVEAKLLARAAELIEGSAGHD
jgi:hypothetical protein